MRMRFSMMRKIRTLMMTSRKMMERMTRMMRMRKRRLLKESPKANPNTTISPKETKLSPLVETKDNKEESPSEATKKEDTKATSHTSITIMVETEEASIIEEDKEANPISITTTVDTEVDLATEEEAMVESPLSIKVATTGRTIREVTKTGKIIREESLSTKETDSHSFIATNQFSLFINAFLLPLNT